MLRMAQGCSRTLSELGTLSITFHTLHLIFSAMRVFLFATASVALALEEADHADVEESLSLLQLSARPRSVAENADDLNAHDVDDLVSAGVPSYPITWDIRRS